MVKDDSSIPIHTLQSVFDAGCLRQPVPAETGDCAFLGVRWLDAAFSWRVRRLLLDAAVSAWAPEPSVPANFGGGVEPPLWYAATFESGVKPPHSKGFASQLRIGASNLQSSKAPMDVQVARAFGDHYFSAARI